VGLFLGTSGSLSEQEWLIPRRDKVRDTTMRSRCVQAVTVQMNGSILFIRGENEEDIFNPFQSSKKRMCENCTPLQVAAIKRGRHRLLTAIEPRRPSTKAPITASPYYQRDHSRGISHGRRH
jgi:hypothetical protein